MNRKIEEILKDLFKDENVNGFILSDERFEELKEYIICLQTRIDKSIDYIMTNLISEWDIENGGCVSGSDLPVDAITPILDILKGKNEINWQERYLDLEERIFKALHLIKHNDIYDYSVFEEKLKNILNGVDEK